MSEEGKSTEIIRKFISKHIDCSESERDILINHIESNYVSFVIFCSFLANIPDFTNFSEDQMIIKITNEETLGNDTNGDYLV